MNHKEIEKYQQQKAEILKKTKPERREDLVDLARKVGASTSNWARMGGENDATESQLVDNIERALQAAATIDMCKTASRSWIIAVVAVIISTLSALAAWCAVLTK